MSGKEKQDDLSRFCRSNCGLDAKEVALKAKVPRRTFYDWWNGERRRVVELIVLGIKAEQDNKS